ncbi:hypothetical protein CEXT_152131 [Caerostris extrusa]|uniref:Uncharacterized protein n=1 Tax=Caerostris extrusa TaxID=172846 RepID=A0AAV4VHI5_CAEEX|nr:hypothetical protein CEXT_152131 [Caerostris extrusa]
MWGILENKDRGHSRTYVEDIRGQKIFPRRDRGHSRTERSFPHRGRRHSAQRTFPSRDRDIPLVDRGHSRTMIDIPAQR